jgi:hypothetical protein
VFLKYCKDLSEREGEFIQLSFIGGGLHLQDMHYVSQQAGKAIAWEELGDIDYEEIEAHYEREPNKDQAT